jgi:hypothetical protein
MFWDVAPIVPGREDTVREVVKVLEATLALDSAVCQHAALHGLGHWHHAAPDEVSLIVGRWLQGHPQAPDKLRDYAAQASVGSVL